MKKGTFYLWLKEEVQIWIRERLITAEQAKAILSRSGASIAERESEAGTKKITSYIVGLGAILLGIGIILFYASNWEQIPRAVKLFSLYAALGASYIFGFRMSYATQSHPILGSALLLLGSILFGAAIFLQAQIYNIHAHYPNGFLLWAAGILPLAYVLSSRSILTLGLGVLSVWIATEMSFWMEHYRYGKEATFYFVLFGVWSVFLYAWGSLHTLFERTRPLAGVYRLLSIVGILFISFLLGFRDIWPYRGMEYGTWDEPKTALAVLTFLGLLSAGLSFFYRKPASSVLKVEMHCVVLFLIILIGSSFISDPGASDAGNYSYYGYHHNVLYPVLFNLVMFAASIGVVLLGYRNRNIGYVNLGTFFIGMQILVRYIEYSWSMMDRSLFFTVGGILLLSIGYVLEKKRRKIVKHMTAV